MQLRRSFPIVVGMILLASAVPALASEGANKELVKRYVETCLDQSDLECLGTFWVSEKVDRVRESEELRRSLFPDLDYELVDSIAEGDRVAAVLKVRASHEDESGANTTKLETTDVVLYTVEDGLIQSGEVFSDKLAVAQALGYTIEPPSDE